MRYRKKPIIIEAEQLCWSNWSQVCALFDGKVISRDNPARNSEAYSDTCGEVGPSWIELTIPTLEGDQIVRHGDYIVKGVDGEFYHCKPDIFELMYEPVEKLP